MNLRPKALIVILPLLVPLAIGWFFILIGFARIHQEFYINVSEDIRPDSDLYVVTYLQFWTFVFGVPAFAVLAVLHAITDNFILGMITRTVLCACTVALGGCLALTSSVFAVLSANNSTLPERDYYILSLVGQVISLITLFILYGISPWLIETFSKDSSENRMSKN